MSVPSLALVTSGAITALLSQSVDSPTQWGVFDSQGNSTIQPDSTVKFRYSRRYEVARYPIIKGSFASYNKVINPYEIELRFTKGGEQSDRRIFIHGLEQLVASIELFTVLTPEEVYQNANPTHFEINREGGRGAFWLADVSLFFEEILQSQAQYTTTAVNLPNADSPAAQPTSNVGSVQPYQPTGILLNDGQAATTSFLPGTY
jgi:hypothetical protein